MRPTQFLGFFLAILLTWIAGFVDAVGFLTFARIYTANMSGNSVALGIALGQHNSAGSLFRFWPILLYLAGLLFGRALIEIGVARKTRCIASVAFTCEVILLATVSLLANPASWQFTAIGLLALAMGIQNSALTQFSTLTLHTGFVTGTLLKFTEHLVACFTKFFASLRQNNSTLHAAKIALKDNSFRLSLVLALTFLAYVLGAALGAWGKSVSSSNALFAPIFGLVLLILVDLHHPLAVQDEQKQAELE